MSHITLIINGDISQEYLDILQTRMLENGYATEWQTKILGYRNILIEAKKVIWDLFEEELSFIAQRQPMAFIDQTGCGAGEFQILIRGKEDDFQFHSYIWHRENRYSLKGELKNNDL